jgi:hypothetical protein
MVAAFRVHLVCAAALVLVALLWLRLALALPQVNDQSNRLESLQQDLVSGQIAADSAPILAQLWIQDASIGLEKRLAWLSAVLDPRLQHAVRIPAHAEEDPQALLALVLHPKLEVHAQGACPAVPPGLAVICDPVSWAELRAQIMDSFVKVIATQPEFAAAGRVGGNDIALSASDRLCRLGQAGKRRAQALIQSADPAVQTLGVLALGCAGARTGVGADLQGALNLSGGAGLAAILECGVASDCTLPPSESSGPKGALRSYALTLQKAGQ